MADEDCCILYDAQAKTYRLVPVSDSKFVDLKRFKVMGYARGKGFSHLRLASYSNIYQGIDGGATSTPEPRIPRPPNAWIIYRSHKSKEIRKKVPHVTAGYICKQYSHYSKFKSNVCSHTCFSDVEARELCNPSPLQRQSN